MINIEQTEKVIPETDRMGLANALIYMHRQRMYISDNTDFARALDAILLFFDEMYLLTAKGKGGDLDDQD